MKKYIISSLAILMCLGLLGCGTMMFLLGDNFRYSVSGKVENSKAPSNRGIEGVMVTVECPGVERSIYQNKEGVTDGDGGYRLSGYWDLQGCKIRFTRDKYTPQVIEITKVHFVKREGLSLSYKLDVGLDPE
jgi:hypothetical protein